MNIDISKLIQKFQSYPIYTPVNKAELEKVIDIFCAELFPVSETANPYKSHAQLTCAYNILFDNISKVLDKEKTETALTQFFEKLPALQQRLYGDAQVLLENDPAAKSLGEVILTYPGFYALLVHRIAHELYKLNIPTVPRLFSEYAHTKTGVDIHPGASIGDRFFLDHGNGTVIGETCIIGNNVMIYQGVTLGALYVNKRDSQAKRHPTIEDNVIIYACATILGADTIIGHDSIVGGNVWLTHSIPPFSTVYYTSEIRIKTNNEI